MRRYQTTPTETLIGANRHYRHGHGSKYLLYHTLCTSSRVASTSWPLAALCLQRDGVQQANLGLLWQPEEVANANDAPERSAAHLGRHRVGKSAVLDVNEEGGHTVVPREKVPGRLRGSDYSAA